MSKMAAARITKQQRQTAYHEAGHAVMYVLWGYGFEYVEIEQKNLKFGDKEYPINGRIHGVTIDDPIIVMAGCAAQVLLTSMVAPPRYPKFSITRALSMALLGDVGDWADLKTHIPVLTQLYGRTWEQDLWEMTIDLCRLYWSEISTVAERLLESRILGYAEIKKIVDDGQKARSVNA